MLLWCRIRYNLGSFLLATGCNKAAAKTGGPMNKTSNKLLVVLVIFALVGVVSRASAWQADSPISPLPPPPPTPTEPSIIREPPAVCEMTLECAGTPGAMQQCNGFVTQDEGRMIVVELHTAYKAPFNASTKYISEGLYKWWFQVNFVGVPCYLGKPYAKFYLKAVDMLVPPPYYDFICQEIHLTHDDCHALPLVPCQGCRPARATPEPGG
jgi:hypothetical protein